MKVYRHAIIIITIILLLLAAGCGKKAADTGDTTTESTADKISKKDLKQFDKEVQELLTRNDNYKKPKPTSFAKISTALDKKEITKEQWTMLIILAAYAPDKVPDKYKGVMPTTGRTNLQEAKWYMNEHWDEFSKETQKVLEPFYVWIDDPKSFHNADKDKKSKILKRLEVIPSVEAAGLAFLNVKISTSPVKWVLITYPANNAAAKQRAQWINESILKAWPMFEGLLTKYPNQKIYLLLANTGSDYGQAYMKDVNSAKRCIIEINDTLDKKNTQSTTSHELFHCFQYYIPLKYDKKPRMWMMEATATWSEHWVWPDYNKEWEYLSSFFDELDQDMITWNEKREYSTYPWYLFLTQFTGSTGQVKKDLFAVKDTDGRVVVSSTEYFDMLFGQFALWNWNLKPEEMYQDAPKFPTGSYQGSLMRPNGPSYDGATHEKDKVDHAYIEVKALAMGYRVHVFKDGVDKVVFKFKDKGDSKKKRQALIRIGDIWHWEDWTDIKERKFCRTRDDEKVIGVVVIGSNANTATSSTHEVEYEINTKGKCNPEWRGTTTWSWSHGTSWQVLYANHKLKWQGSMTSRDVLVYDEAEDEFLVKDQYITFSYLKSHDISLNHDCGLLLENSRLVQRGSAHNTWEIDKDNMRKSKAPSRMSVDSDDPMLYKVDVTLQDYKKDWITSISSKELKRKACELEGIFTPGPGTYHKSNTDYSKGNTMASYPDGVDIQISDDGKKISGTKMQDMGAGGDEWKVRIDVDYRYG